MESQKYYLGLDIGTDSVGFCVTDQDYSIITKRAVRHGLDNKKYFTKKHLWGARLFDEAQTAKERRSHRAARRRLQRRRMRLLLLQEIFHPEMDKVDPHFFERLNSSFFHREDKGEDIRSMSLLFADHEKEKKFRTEYPTIYHLRQRMIQNPNQKFDLREIYLVLAHMIKYRGNFLTEGELSGSSTSAAKLKADFDEIDAILKELPLKESSPALFHMTKEQAEELCKLFREESGIKMLKEKEAERGIVYKNSGEEYDIRQPLLELINGSKKSLDDLFPEYKEDEERKEQKINFEDADFDETIDVKLDLLNEVQGRLILKAKEIRDFRILSHILKGKPSLTDAMVDIYDTHRKHLGILKHFYHTYLPEKYKEFFKTSGPVQDKKKCLKNYVNYVAYNRRNNGKKEIALQHLVSQEDLCKEILKELGAKENLFDEADQKTWSEIKPILEANEFLPKQNSKNNSVLPYQLNYNEMKIILDNQKRYYPFLGEEDVDFLHPNERCYKILSLLSYKIPYYVGPLSKEAKEAWMMRKQEDVKITPWNFHEVVDENRSSQEFIKRMTNTCTYLYGEPTLPRFSLRYSLFVLYNEMNNWLLNGKKLSKEDKGYLIENVYLTTKNPKLSSLIKALRQKYNAKSEDEIDLTTRTGKELLEEDMHANLAPFIDMENPRGFGERFWTNQETFEKAEEVIEALTVFEDRKMREEQLQSLGLSASQVRYFSSLRYKGWGRVSKLLLDGLKSPVVDENTAEEKDMTIIELMREFPLSFQEIYETKEAFSFKEQVEDRNKESMEEDGETDIIDAQYCSPAMKRALRQTTKIVAELKRILGIDHFDTYFIECTRDDQKRKDASKKKRTTSRKKQLEALYKACHFVKEEADLFALLEGKEESELRSDKLFLYFLQCGKDVYTGERIDLNELKDYDIDHIIPRAKVKDDSLDNRVLVRKERNNKKSDQYPIPNGVLTNKGREHIKFLYSKMDKSHKHLLMSKTKYERLMRPESKPLTEEELVGFVNRQLVITSQSVKATCDILKQIDPESRIVYSKASTVSEFRKAFDLVKCRDVNDFHHAQDAYLNIVVGNVYDKVFSGSFDVKKLREQKEYYEGTKIDPEHFFKKDKYHIIGYGHQTGAKVWKAKRYLDATYKTEDPNSEGTIDLVRANLQLHDPLVTILPHKQPGLFRKVSINSTQKKAVLPLKQNGVLSQKDFASKYGGYNDLTAPFFMLVKSEGKKGKHIYSLENIPAVFQEKTSDERFVMDYLTKNENGPKLKNPVIILPKVLIKSVIELHPDENDKSKAVRIAINGKTGPSFVACNLSQLWLPEEMIKYVKAISVLLGNGLPKGERADLSKYANSYGPITFKGFKLTREENNKFFDYLCDDVFKRPCFALLSGIKTTICDVKTNRSLFDDLPTIQQEQLLNELVKILQKNNSGANLTYLSRQLVPNSGKIVLGKSIPANTLFIAQSVTGFYEKVLFQVPED